jgi:hypothetical protein
MRFFAVFLFLAVALMVAAAPKNTPQYDPEAVAEFNAWMASQGSEKRDLNTFEKVPIPRLLNTSDCTSNAHSFL